MESVRLVHVFRVFTYFALRNIFCPPIDFKFWLQLIFYYTTKRKICHSRLFFLTVADPLDHATGLEKRELLAHLAGNDVSCSLPRIWLLYLLQEYFYRFDDDIML